MKKFYILLTALFCAATMVAQQAPKHAKPVSHKAPANAATFTFNDIQNWSGEGSNSAALVIKWTGSEYSWVFGYHFDGDKTGADMVMDIAANNPRFFVMAANTNFGKTIGGFGWDADNNGFTLNDKNGNAMTPDENGIYNLSSTSFDGYVTASDADFWNSGWMQGYWSYNLATNPAEKISYASTGCTGRKLTDGCWDLWLFSSFSGGSNTWGDFEAIPANEVVPTAVDDIQTSKTIANVTYSNLAGQMSEKPFSGVNIVVTTFTDGTKVTAKCIK